MKSKRNSKASSPDAAGEGALRLTPATKRDLDAWRAMRADLYAGVDEAFNEFEMQLILGSHDRVCLLVRAPNDDAVGFIEVSLRNVVDGCLGGPVGYIEGIYLVPTWRGLGLGPGMIEAVAEWFKSQGCRDMATDAEMENPEAQQFWADLGFEETWRIVQYRKSLGEAVADEAPRAKRASSRPAKAKKKSASKGAPKKTRR
jgi:aminoglycoside 6'-N-acetyltransferase I